MISENVHSPDAAVEFDVCIVNFNTKHLTLACIEHVKKAVRNFRCEIWVVDNGSTDGSIEMLRQISGIRLICRTSEQPEEGHTAHANAIDLVFEASNKEYLILMHTDTIVYDANAISMLLDAASSNPKFGAVGCLFQVYHGRIGSFFRRLKKFASYRRKEILHRCGLRSKAPKIDNIPVHIRSFFALWNIAAMKSEGLRFNMGNRNPGYVAQEMMAEQGYQFPAIPPEIFFQYIDHLEAATVAGVNPYHFKHRKSRPFQRKLKRIINP